MLGLAFSPWRGASRRRWPKPGENMITAFSGGTLGPGLIADFKRRRYALPKSMTAAQILAATPAQIAAALKSTAFADLFDFARASAATYFDASGTLVTADINQPRFTPDGLLLEGPATNFIRNSVLGGAVVGALGSGGQLATNLSMSAAVGGDLVTSVAAIGVESGYAYIDIRFVGQNTTPRYLNLESSTTIPAVAGDARLFSAMVRLVAGSLANTSDLQIVLSERNTSGTNATGSLATGVDIKPTITSGARRSLSRTIAAADAAYVLPYIRIPAATGPVDFTLRLALLQCEAGLEASSPIMTNGSAVTRAADNAKLSAKAAAVLQRVSAGLLIQGSGTKGAYGRIIGGSTGSTGQMISLSSTENAVRIGRAAPTTIAAVTTPLPNFGLAAGWSDSGRAGSYQGSATVVTASVLDVDLSNIYIGRDGSGNFAPGYYRQFVAWPARPADAALAGKAVAYV